MFLTWCNKSLCIPVLIFQELIVLAQECNRWTDLQPSTFLSFKWCFIWFYKTCLPSLSASKDLPPTDQDRFVSFFFLIFSVLLRLDCVHTDACKNFKTMESVYTELVTSVGQKWLSPALTVCVCHARDKLFVSGYIKICPTKVLLELATLKHTLTGDFGL